MKSFMPNTDKIERKWYVIDAEDMVLGRMATEIASILRGKHKPIFTPHADTGDFVIVINAEKVRVTGNKDMQKTYFRHSQYAGGDKHIPYQEMLEKHPERIIQLAVKGMLPKNKLGRQMIRKLKVYSGSEHKHEAQQPEVYELD